MSAQCCPALAEAPLPNSQPPPIFLGNPSAATAMVPTMRLQVHVGGHMKNRRTPQLVGGLQIRGMFAFCINGRHSGPVPNPLERTPARKLSCPIKDLSSASVVAAPLTLRLHPASSSHSGVFQSLSATISMYSAPCASCAKAWGNPKRPSQSTCTRTRRSAA